MALDEETERFVCRSPAHIARGQFDQFESWLTSEEYAEYRRTCINEDSFYGPESLFDVIQIWLYFGDAVEACGSYTLYLQTVFDIVSEWASSSDHRFLDRTPLWQLTDELNGPCKAFDSMVWPGGPRNASPAIMHPAINPATWEIIVAQRRYPPDL